MHHSTATSFFEWHCGCNRRLTEMVEAGFGPSVGFVAPIVSTTMAAACTNYPTMKTIPFAADARGYADNIGLLDVLAGRPIPLSSGVGRIGRTYSRLTRLQSPDDVNRCNSAIIDLFAEQLPDEVTIVDVLGKIVGELHDNVASHARGAGYSAAQVYNRGGVTYIEIAVADSGCGMLRNVQNVKPEITTHAGAVDWCLGKRNTTWRPRGAWAQRLPGDSVCSPYPPGTETFSDDNHHIGLGLWQLTEIARQSDSELWIWSGDCELRCDGPRRRVRQNDFSWQGVAVEVSLSVQKLKDSACQYPRDWEQLAEKWGLQ